MRTAGEDQSWNEYLLKIGEGRIAADGEEKIQILPELLR